RFGSKHKTYGNHAEYRHDARDSQSHWHEVRCGARYPAGVLARVCEKSRIRQPTKDDQGLLDRIKPSDSREAGWRRSLRGQVQPGVVRKVEFPQVVQNDALPKARG